MPTREKPRQERERSAEAMKAQGRPRPPGQGRGEEKPRGRLQEERSEQGRGPERGHPGEAGPWGHRDTRNHASGWLQGRLFFGRRER